MGHNSNLILISISWKFNSYTDDPDKFQLSWLIESTAQACINKPAISAGSKEVPLSDSARVTAYLPHRDQHANAGDSLQGLRSLLEHLLVTPLPRGGAISYVEICGEKGYA